MKVIIVGGGIAGLATAAFLRQRTEVKVHVLERAPLVVPPACSSENNGETTDYGIAVAPNGSTCLSMLGMHDHVKELGGSELTEILVRFADNDQSTPGQPFPGRQMFGVPSVFCRRSALLQWLYNVCVDDRQDGRHRVRFTTDCRVDRIDARAGVVKTVDDQTYQADLLICADGIAKAGHKAVRSAIEEERGSVGEPTSRSEFIVQCLYMANVSAAALEERPSLRFLLHGDKRVAASCTGRSTLANWCHGFPSPGASLEESVQVWRTQLRLILYPVDFHGNHQLFATMPATEEMLEGFGRGNSSSTNGEHDRQKPGLLRNVDSTPVYEAYHMYDEEVRSLLRLNSQMDLGLMRDSDPLDRWSVAGKTVLVGDAAHASIQHTGQGSAQALEDAEALSYCLAEHLGTGKHRTTSLAEVLERFERIRIPRAHRVQHAARMACGMAPGMDQFDFAEYNMYVHAWPGAQVALARAGGAAIDGQT